MLIFYHCITLLYIPYLGKTYWSSCQPTVDGIELLSPSSKISGAVLVGLLPDDGVLPPHGVSDPDSLPSGAGDVLLLPPS